MFQMLFTNKEYITQSINFRSMAQKYTFCRGTQAELLIIHLNTPIFYRVYNTFSLKIIRLSLL